MKDANKLVIRIEQRNGKKAWTIVENIEVLKLDNDEVKQLVKFLKKKLSCNGCLKKEKETNVFYIQFQGKHAEFLKTIFEEKKLISDDKITVIGDF